MTDTSTGEQSQSSTLQPQVVTGSAGDVFASGEQAVRRVICNNPGMALAVSAAIGVLLACLIKRR
jgi:hypothetical protein